MPWRRWYAAAGDGRKPSPLDTSRPSRGPAEGGARPSTTRKAPPAGWGLPHRRVADATESSPRLPPMGTLLEFHDLVRGFGGLPVLSGVSGRVERGQVLVVSGRNGSGKSTLLRCLAGLLRPQEGTVLCREGGEELSTRERRLRVGYVAPDLSLYEALTGAENLRFFARLRRVPSSPAEELLEALGVPAHRPVGALSSGMRQRLRWVWALLHGPRVLLLDEPFQNLDATGESAVRRLLAHHLRDGLAVVATPSPLELDFPLSRLELA